jgi:DNA polymerase-1
MLIGEAPGQREDDSGTPFVGNAGRLLDAMLRTVDLSRDDFYITNAVHCRPPSNRTPTKREINACKKWIDYEIAEIKPKIIGLLGGVALQSVLGLKGIKKLRGRPIDRDGIVYLPMYHPAYVLRGDGREQAVAEQDLRTLRDIIEFGGIPEERELRLHWVDTQQKVDEMLDALTGIVSVDIETTCLYPWAEGAAVTMIGFGTRVGEFNLPVAPQWSTWSHEEIWDIVERITERLDDCISVYQNGKFDCLWMLVHYGVDWHNDFDTMLGHYLIDENSMHDLEYLAKLYFGAPNWDIPLEEKQGRATREAMGKYHAHDLFYTRKLYFKIKAELDKDPEIRRVFTHLLMPAARLFVKMEARGCYIDAAKMRDAEKYLIKERDAAEQRLRRWGDINWGSPQQVARLLYGELKIKCPEKTKKGAPSTSESTLNQISHPAVADLIKFRGHKQQLSFFVDGWKPYLVNNRIHPSFKLHGTVTGRPSSVQPNFQQVPRDTRIRSQIVAPPGWTLLEADLSQIELRLIAHASQVPSMMEAFRTGIDIHWKTALSELERYAGQRELVIDTARTAKQLFLRKSLSYAEAMEILREIGPDAAADINPLWKEMRKKAKAVGFGYVYGMWYKKFKIYARDNYDIHLTDEEARQSREAYFDLYPLEKWHTKQQRLAREYGFVRTFTGRKRRLPHAQDQYDTYERSEAWRQAINSPIQGTASDLNLMVLLQLADEFPSSIVKPIITVHDSILAEVRDSHVERVVHRIEEIMRGPALLKTFGIQFSVPICGEIKLGPWGSGISLEKWKQLYEVA